MTMPADIVASAEAADGVNGGIVVLLESDRTLAKLIAVWGNVPVSADPDPAEEYPAGLPESLQWRWVWSRLDPDPCPTWIAYAGLPDAPHIRRTVQLAIDNRIVFPDGSLSSWASVYLQRVAKLALGVREARAPGPSPLPEPAPAPSAPDPLAMDDDPLAVRPGRRLRPQEMKE